MSALFFTETVDECYQSSKDVARIKRLKSISKNSIAHFKFYIEKMDTPWLAASRYF